MKTATLTDSILTRLSYGKFFTTTFFLVAFLLSRGAGADDFSQWKYNKKITINTTSVGLSSMVTKFPYVIRLDSKTFDFNKSQLTGQDIRFSNSNGKSLPYQIERWDKSKNVADIWVLVDTVRSNDSTQYFKMYWGNDTASVLSNGPAVFDTANGFSGVWHLGETGGDTAREATVNRCNAINHGTSFQQTGTIGYANSLSGNGQFLDAGNNSKLRMDAFDRITISAWVKRAGNNASGAGAYEAIAGKFNWTTGDYREYEIGSTTDGGFRFNVSTDGTSTTSAETMLTSGVVPVNGTWYYMTGTVDGSNMYVYVNAEQRGSSPKAAISGSQNASFKIGVMEDDVNDPTGHQYWNGTIDEVRVEKVARSPDWIKLCYANQQLSSIITAFGPAIGNYLWDNATTEGYQAASGTWGTSNFWTINGTTLGAWPGTGCSATFTNTTGDSEPLTITVNGTQNIDSIAFLNSGFTLSGGMLNFGTRSGVLVASGKTATISSAISGSAGLNEYGEGTLILSGVNTYTGATNIRSGKLIVTGSLAVGSAVTVGTASILAGTGTINGSVDARANGAIIAPGTNGAGTLKTGALTFGSSSILNFELGTNNDSIKVTGNLTLNGTLNVTTVPGFGLGTYTLLTYTGTLKDSILSTGTMPDGFLYVITAASGIVTLKVTPDLAKPSITTQPVSLVKTAGQSVSFSVVAAGYPVPTYQWRKNDTPISGATSASYAIAALALGDTGTYDVVITNSQGSVTSNSVKLSLSPSSIKAAFTIPETTGKTPFAVQFTDKSTGEFTKRIWDFGDKTTDTTNTQNPLHVYGTAGTFTAKLVLLSSTVRQDSFTVTIKTETPSDITVPVNVATISGKYLGGTSVLFSVNGLLDVDTSVVDTFGIWYSTESTDTTPNFTQATWIDLRNRLTTIKSSGGADNITVDNQSFNTSSQKKFYCAIVLKSKINDKLSLPAQGFFYTGANTNSVRITSLVFDTSKNEIKVKWNAKVDLLDTLQIGISYSVKGYPTTDTSIHQFVPVTGSIDSAVINLMEPLVFSSSPTDSSHYYVSLWISKDKIIVCAPTDSSKQEVLIPYYTWQNVPTSTSDTIPVYAFNNQIRLKSKPGQVLETANIVRTITPGSTLLAGSIQAGLAFEYENKSMGTPFYTGIKISNLPSRFSIEDVNIYRDSAGVPLLVREKIVRDTINGYISVLTNNLILPFVALVDTTSPSVKIGSDTTKVLTADIAYTDTFTIVDNIGNVSWRLYTARGDEAFDTLSDGNAGVLHKVNETLILTIDSRFVSGDNGVRAILVTSDGRNTNSIDVSRRVTINTSPGIRVEVMKWTPLSTTAELDSTSIASIMQTGNAGDNKWTYDNMKCRIFRWSNLKDNANNTGKWIEYADSLKQQFDLKRGNLVWVKMKTATTVVPGKSITPSLKSSVVIKLAPKAFTDVSSPFGFGIKIGDILSATKELDGNREDLLINRWETKPTSNQYIANIVYSKYLEDPLVNSLSTVLSPNSSGYTIYNPYPDTVNLIIPPTPVALSKITALAKSTHNNGWSIRLVSRTSDSCDLTTVYCGYADAATQGTSYFPSAPSFGGLSIGVTDAQTKKIYGHAVAHSVSNGGCTYVIAYKNPSSSSVTIQSRLYPSFIPESMNASLYNSETGASESAQNGTATITVGPNQTVYRLLSVGTSAYLAKASRSISPLSELALLGVYPNPCRGAVRIRYSLPFNSVKNISFALYNLSGKVVWQHEINEPSHFGNCDFAWNGKGANGKPVGTGVYLLRMTVISGEKNKRSVFERKISIMQ